MRFMGEGRDGQEGRNENIPAGTIIDRNVVDPRAFDWYGAAHTGILGTTRPTRYVVMDGTFLDLLPASRTITS